jgi:hypothetical protein
VVADSQSMILVRISTGSLSMRERGDKRHEGLLRDGDVLARRTQEWKLGRRRRGRERGSGSVVDQASSCLQKEGPDGAG